MIEQLQNDASDTNPELAAELQAKYDCWISAVATGQDKTASECRARFERTMTALRDCRGGRVVNGVSARMLRGNKGVFAHPFLRDLHRQNEQERTGDSCKQRDKEDIPALRDLFPFHNDSVHASSCQARPFPHCPALSGYHRAGFIRSTV